jgi:hypothetical protein
MQGIEIQRQAVSRGGDYRTTEHGHRLALGLASRWRRRAGRRWRRQGVPTDRAKPGRPGHVLATVGTPLPQASATCRTKRRVRVIGVLAGRTAASAWLGPRRREEPWGCGRRCGGCVCQRLSRSRGRRGALRGATARGLSRHGRHTAISVAALRLDNALRLPAVPSRGPHGTQAALQRGIANRQPLPDLLA